MFARSFVYEERANVAIREAGRKWANIEEILAAMEWGLARDPLMGRLINERGIRGFVHHGARSTNEPDVDCLYADEDPTIIIHDLVFRDAKAHYAGNA
jgi:hypothetical protein